MSPFNHPRLPYEQEDEAAEARDREARARAVDPRFNVALEASAGTGKTRVLVDRYLNLLLAGVDPSNILAITFTRKAASEMRDRITAALRAAAAAGALPAGRWRELRDRTADIAITTIDAFCLSLLREFPLEADLDPGFSIADEAEVPRLVDESLERALQICRGIAAGDEQVSLVFAQLGDRRVRAALATLLNRRTVASAVLARQVAAAPRDLTGAHISRKAADALLDALESIDGGLDRFIETGPPEPAFLLLVREVAMLREAARGSGPMDPARLQAALTRLREHFLTQDGQPRVRLRYVKARFATEADWRFHRQVVAERAAAVAAVHTAYRRDLNVLVACGLSRMFQVAEREYRRTLDAHAVLDFSDLLLRALDLLRQLDEFSQSRYRLESRFHHVLVDEFQDTSRAQWELILLLVQSWGEGAGLAHSGPLQPSIFIVGDAKQSIYGFRDADVCVLREALRHLESLRRDGPVRRAISRSYRSVPPLLSFINDVGHDIATAPGRADAFRYDDGDRFPLSDSSAAADGQDARPLGLVMADTPEACAEVTAGEIERLIAARSVVRDRETGLPRAIRAGDVAILFRTRDSHREFEAALESRGLSAFVYKGLGFYDADEVRDVLALLSWLADPQQDVRAAALMRSRFIRLSDEGLRRLAPRLARALVAERPPDTGASLDSSDARTLAQARVDTLRWLRLADRLPPADLLDRILAESAYACELRGPRFHQARENLKKIRGLVRRIQNRGYATLGRVSAHLDRLAVGDEANAVVDAVDAVNLMTVHAAKGLEFPVVFLVNLARGTVNRRPPVRIAETSGREPVAVGDFQSESDEDQVHREREETKRLLYVALTRARDRLYIGSVLKDGSMQPGRGSLAEVLPQGLRDLFTVAHVRVDAVEWRASSGTSHRFRVVPPPSQSARRVRLEPQPEVAACDLSSLERRAPRRQSITAAGRAEPNDSISAERLSDRLTGLIVHRLLQRYGLQLPVVIPQGEHGGLSDQTQQPAAEMPSWAGSEQAMHEAALSVLRAEERVLTREQPNVVGEAISAYRMLCARTDLRALWLAGERLHEVPFTMQTDEGVVRGTIDCLVRTGPDRWTVLEFKTGRPRQDHHQQLQRYRQAAERLFPGATVDGRLVYAQAPAFARVNALELPADQPAPPSRGIAVRRPAEG